MTTDSSFLHLLNAENLLLNLLLHLILPYLLLLFSVENFQIPWQHWAHQLPLNKLGNRVTKKTQWKFKMSVITLNVHNQAYIHCASMWISATWWGVWDLPSFFPGEKLLQFHYWLKIWIIYFPDSHFKKNKELL